MTLREILKGKNNIRIKEYERWGDGLILQLTEVFTAMIWR